MELINIEGTPKTPTITMNAESGVIDIKGRSIPENSIEFYKPIVDWLEEYAKTPASKTVVNVQLEYFNTSSSKCLLDVFRRLETINLSGKSSVKVSWFYDVDDEDMMEAGEDYSALVKIPFEMMKA